MRRLNYAIIGVAVLVFLVAFGSESIGAVLFFFPFTMLPFAVHAGLARSWQSPESQAVVLAANLAYAGWFAFVYLNATVWHPDPQGAIAFLFMGIYAAPVLLILWWVSYILEFRGSKQAGV